MNKRMRQRRNGVIVNSFYLSVASTDVISFFSQENLKSMLFEFFNGAKDVGINVIISILIWVIGKKIVQFGVQVLRKALNRTSLDIGVVKFVCSLTRFLAYIVLVIQIIGKLGFETSTFIALLGSAGLAFGLALQGSLSNFAGGVLILIFKPFRVGDYIISGLNEGTVKVIDLLYTKLVTGDNKIITIPNGALANSSVVNVGSQEIRRLDIQVGIGYDADLKKAKDILKEIMVNQSQILKDQEISVVVKSLDNNQVTLETRAWVNTIDYWTARCESLESYKIAFDENGIKIPFDMLGINAKK